MHNIWQGNHLQKVIGFEIKMLLNDFETYTYTQVYVVIHKTAISA